MKRFFHLICLLALAALLPAALLISRGLPADTHPFVEQKYAGWNGVLRAWICVDWECAGSFTRWLNNCAARFEKNHDGVYVEFTPVRGETLRQMSEDGIRPPELILFSPGTLDDLSMFKTIDVPDALRNDLRSVGGSSFPVAMGGYIQVYNRELTDGTVGFSLAMPTDDASHSFSSAAIALLCDVAEDSPSDEALPDAGLDLGLPAGAMTEDMLTFSDDAVNRFILGELPAIVVSQGELTKLIRLRDAGRGPDWNCKASGMAAYTDQLLMLGIVNQTGNSSVEREALAEAFAKSLLEYDSQAKLADIGAFSVTGERIYSDFSAYAQLDALLNGRELIVPANPLHMPPDCTNLLRAFMSGSLDANSALAQLRFAVQ